MLEMKKLLLEYKTKIKYYKKHKLNNHLQTNLINTLDRLNAIKEETIKTYKYNKNNSNKNDDKNNDDDDNFEKCKFENCDRIATYRKLKVGNCHLKDRKYEYCSYHKPKNLINKNFHINQYLIK